MDEGGEFAAFDHWFAINLSIFYHLIKIPEPINWSPNEVDLDSEPWALGGGLLPDLQKLIMISPKLAEIFTIKFAIPLSLKCYHIHPVNLLDINKVSINYKI
jgi:hypothetical protein